MNLRPYIAFLVGAAGLFASSVDGVSACPTNKTLQYYTDNFGQLLGGSCAIGSLKYYNFGFAKLQFDASSDTGSYPIDATKLNIVPDSGTSSFGIIPSNTSLFNRPITAPERYLISYTIDPPPIIAGDELFLDPPSNSTIFGTKWGCIDSGFFTTGGTLPAILLGVSPSSYTASMGGKFNCDSSPNSTPYILQVDGLASDFSNVKDTILFPTLAYKLDVKIVLDFQPGNITGFDGTLPTAILNVPEPSTTMLIAFSLVGAGLFRRRNRKS